MSAARLASGGSDIDRSKPLTFSFDGRTVEGFAGDTIASTLLAGNQKIVARSFKYHRPRGIWGAGVEEPNALVDIETTRGHIPNARATTLPAENGVTVKSVNATPTALSDRNAFLDRFARFIPAAFYYKTFMWPDWHLFEPRVRAMAGLGVVDRDWKPARLADQILLRNTNVRELELSEGEIGDAEALDLVRDPRRLRALQDQAAGTTFGALGRIGHHEERDEIGDAAELDPLLAAVDAELVAVAHRGRLEVAQIGARLRLGDARGRDPVAGQQLAEPAPLLLRIAEEMHRAWRHDLAEHDRALGERLEQKTVVDEGETGTARIPRDRGAYIAEWSEALVDAAHVGVGELAALRDGLGDRPDQCLDRFPRPLLQLVLRLAQ